MPLRFKEPGWGPLRQPLQQPRLRRPDAREQPRLAGYVLLLALVAMVLLPGILLNYLGISYTHLGGAPWEKLHPSTYIALLALLIASTSRTDPVHFLLTMARQESRVMIYLGAVAIIAGVTVVTEGIGELGFLVDTLLLPAVVVIVLKVTPPAQQRQIYWVLLWLVVGNALLGIGETAVNQQLIPPTNADGTPFIDAQFRPWALFGHPLNNALITGTGMIVAYPTIRNPLLRLTLPLLLLISLLAFGGRVAFVASLPALLLLVVGEFGRDVSRRRFTPTRGIFVLLLLLAVPLAVFGVFTATGLGDRILDNLVWDNSAEVRLQVFRLIDFLSTNELLFGVSATKLAYLSSRIGREGIIIENFWLVMLARMGVLLFLLFTVAFFVFLSRLWRDAAGAARLALVYFVLIASTNNSLSSKNVALSLIVALMIGAGAVLRAPPRRRALPVRSAPDLARLRARQLRSAVRPAGPVQIDR